MSGSTLQLGQQYVWTQAGGKRSRVKVIDGPIRVADAVNQGGSGSTSKAHYWIQDSRSGKRRCVPAVELAP